MSYLLLKVLHIASVVVFLGNILTGLFWAAHAHRTRDLSIVASTFEGIIRSDRIFTAPGVIGIVASGITTAVVAGVPLLRTGWILWPIVLFSLSGAVFGMRVAPLQRRLATLARTSENSDKCWERYQDLYRQWKLWGLAAMAAPAIAMVIMVLKPPVPAL
jgi:uncharacterized membrane protein